MLGEYIPDILEQGEVRCESQVVGNKIKCAGCGNLINFDDMITMSPDPYAAGFCRECANAT